MKIIFFNIDVAWQSSDERDLVGEHEKYANTDNHEAKDDENLAKGNHGNFRFWIEKK